MLAQIFSTDSHPTRSRLVSGGILATVVCVGSIISVTGCQNGDPNFQPEETSESLSDDLESPIGTVPVAMIEQDPPGVGDQADLPSEPGRSQIQESEQTEAESRQSKDSTDKQGSSDPDVGLLDRAGRLFSEATRGGSESARNAGRWMQDQLGQATDSTGDATRGAVAWANQTFESLKSRGLTTASSTSEWLADDWNNMESWEYKVVNWEPTDPSGLERKLNELGEQGWECFTVTDGQWVFKKRRESYLRRLPFKDLLRLAPLLNSDASK